LERASGCWPDATPPPICIVRGKGEERNAGMQTNASHRWLGSGTFLVLLLFFFFFAHVIGQSIMPGVVVHVFKIAD
jgi:hypothetical protein